mgnify:CR=1 FL=1
MSERVWQAQCGFRIIRDDNILGNLPNRLQQAWLDMKTGMIEWRDVPVVNRSSLKEESSEP